MENVADVFGRQKLESSCTLPYKHQWVECIASLPYGSGVVLFLIYNSPRYSFLAKLAINLAICVEIAHALGHLLQFSYAEELIIVLYALQSLCFAILLYDTALTRKAFWRKLYPTKTIFLFSYAFSSAILIYLYASIGYLASTICQCVMIVIFVFLTPTGTTAQEIAFTENMHWWVFCFAIGTFMLSTEIVYCNDIVKSFGFFPYHALIDIVMGISVYFQSKMMCQMGTVVSKQT